MNFTRMLFMVSGLLQIVLFAGRGVRGIAGPDSISSLPSPSPIVAAATPSPAPFGEPDLPPSPTPVSLLLQQKVTGGFTRYIPDQKGNMEWKLEGATGRFLSPDCLEITDMIATSLAPEIGHLTIAVGKVLYYTETKKARGDESRITVRRDNIVLTGRGFRWSPILEQIRVYEDVKLLIKESGNEGFFPR